MQSVQVKKSGFTAGGFSGLVLPGWVTEATRMFVVSLELKEFQLEWLRTLKASNRSSSLMFSALGMEKDLCREASNFVNGAPLPASLTRLPLTNRKSTCCPVTASLAPLKPTGARKVFWMELH